MKPVKKVYTTTEFLYTYQKRWCWERPLMTFKNKGDAQRDIDWMKKNQPLTAREFDGPLLVEVSFKILYGKRKK